MLTSAMILIVVLYPVVMAEEAAAAFDTQAVMDLILKRNAAYLTSVENPSDITPDLCEDSADNGQHPHVMIVTCSDSCVPA